MKEKLFNRNFTLLILGQVSSLTGNLTLKFALSMYVLERTGSASLFAGLLAASMVPTILLSPFGGILADRADRRAVMVGLDTLSGLSVLLAALALPHGPDLAVIAALLILLSVLAAFESPTVQACVPQMLSGDNVLRGNAMVNQVQALASLATPFLGSLFYAAFGIRPVLWGAVACFFLTALLECFLRLPRPTPGPKSGLAALIRQDFALTLRFLRREQPAILGLLGLAALASMFIAGALVLVSLLAGRMRPRHLSAVFSLVGLCLLAAGGVFLLPLGALGHYLALLVLFCGCQLGCSVFSICAATLIQSRTPAALMGKVMSCVFTLSMCAQPLGQLVYGFLFDRLAPPWVLLPSGLLLCAVGALSAGFFRRMDQDAIGS